MPGVFLSYRRKDGDFAVLLYAWLIERFGADRVFWDREDIDPGSDFRTVLSGTLKGCDALVALIGPAWSPSPWIQREIGASLKRRILVLPVLLGDAAHIEAASLPRPIRRLASLQTLETRDLRFRDRLLKALDAVVVAAGNTGTPLPDGTAHGLRARRLTDLLRAQIDQRQRRALELLVDGEINQAVDVLNETFDLVMALIDFQPGDPSLEVRLGTSTRILPRRARVATAPDSTGTSRTACRRSSASSNCGCRTTTWRAAGMVSATCICSARISTRPSSAASAPCRYARTIPTRGAISFSASKDRRATAR